MNRSHAALALVLVACLVFAQGALTAPVQAQSEDGGVFDGVLSDDEEDASVLASVGDEITRVTSAALRYVDLAEMAVTGTDGQATEYADSVEERLHGSNESIRAYINERVSASADYDAFRVYFHDRDGNNVTRFVVATVDNGSYASGPRMLTPAEFEDTGRTADHWVSLDWYASRHAADELDSFVTEFVTPGENVSRSTQARLLSQYRGSITSSLWGDELPPAGGGS